MRAHWHSGTSAGLSLHSTDSQGFESQPLHHMDYMLTPCGFGYYLYPVGCTSGVRGGGSGTLPGLSGGGGIPPLYVVGGLKIGPS